MKEIPLTQGKVALVDDEDYERVAGLRWRAIKSSYTFYALRKNKKSAGPDASIRLHHFILGTRAQVDHKNLNGLDCRKENMRLCTHSQNQQNINKKSGNTSGYKGVTWDKARKKWRAQIKLNRKNMFLGRFESREEAAMFYDKKASEFFGEFARLNF